MERESFENEKIAEFLNEHFVSIKVDREERPDVDKIYMTFVQSTTGSGGWPLNVFLTPDLKPFFGGTYFPPDNRYGRPSFLQLLQHIAQALGERDTMKWSESADELHAQLEAHHGAATRMNSARLDARRSCATPARNVQANVTIRATAVLAARRNFRSRAMPSFLLRYAKRFNDDEARRNGFAHLRANGGGRHP